MCLTIKNVKAKTFEEALKEKMHIASKDILVYKALNVIRGANGTVKYKSPSKNMTYSPGFEYYQTDEKFGGCVSTSWSGKLRELDIHRGLHSCSSIREAKSWWSCKVFEFTIPKGSQYFKSGNEYVSDRLIFNELPKKK